MVTATAREENGEFCVAVAPATRTAGILTQLVKGARWSRPSGRSGLYTGFNSRRLKALKGDELPRNGPILRLCEIFFLLIDVAARCAKGSAKNEFSTIRNSGFD